MQRSLSRLTDAGIRVVAISVDPPDTSRDFGLRSGFTFTLLSDPELDATRRYDVLDQQEGVARPAEFLVDSAGIVRWRNLTESYYVRARPEQILEAARALR